MTELNTQSEVATPTSLGQCRIAAARKRRFWRTCTNAFLTIHLFALAMVGFMVGDGWMFRLVAASILAAPALAYLEHCARGEASHG